MMRGSELYSYNNVGLLSVDNKDFFFCHWAYASNRFQSRPILLYYVKLYSVQKRDTTASFYKIHCPMHHYSSPQNSFLLVKNKENLPTFYFNVAITTEFWIM